MCIRDSYTGWRISKDF